MKYQGTGKGGKDASPGFCNGGEFNFGSPALRTEVKAGANRRSTMDIFSAEFACIKKGFDASGKRPTNSRRDSGVGMVWEDDDVGNFTINEEDESGNSSPTGLKRGLEDKGAHRDETMEKKFRRLVPRRTTMDIYAADIRDPQVHKRVPKRSS